MVSHESCALKQDKWLQTETLKHLTVLEGSKKAIDKSTLWLETKVASRRVNFNVTRRPSHGHLLLLSKAAAAASHSLEAFPAHLHADLFTSDNLLSSGRSPKLFYQHDGSETEEDSFDFVATGIPIILCVHQSEYHAELCWYVYKFQLVSES